MAQQTLEPPTTSDAPRRRLKPGGRRKLAVILSGTLAGGVVAFLCEAAADLPNQLASTIGGAVTAVVAAGDELRERHNEPRDERLRRLVSGDVYRQPLLIGFYVALAAFLVPNLIALPSAFAAYSTLLFGGYNIADLESWDPHVIQAVTLLGIPLTFVYMLPIAVVAAHRLRRRAFLYITAAVTAMTVLAGAVVLIWGDTFETGFTTPGLLIISVLSFVLALAAIAIGTAWARRTQDAFVMRKLFAQLTPSDQDELIELVKTLPHARAT